MLCCSRGPSDEVEALATAANQAFMANQEDNNDRDVGEIRLGKHQKIS